MSRPARRRSTPRLLPALALVLAAVAGAGPVLAAGTAVETVIARETTTYGYACGYSSASGQWTCTTTSQSGWFSLVQPQAGPVTSFEVRANRPSSGGPMDGATSAMMVDLLNLICTPGDASAFVAGVGQLVVAGSTVPAQAVGPCTLNGGYGTRSRLVQFWVTAAVTAPTPTPTPSPTPTPTPVPRASPTSGPSPTPSAPAAPSPSAADPTLAPAATSGATSPTASASSAPSPAGPAASGSPVARPSGEAPDAGRDSTPAPGSPTPAAGILGWPGSVPARADVRTDPSSTLAAIAAALALLLLMGWAGELFNNTFEGNYGRMVGWWRGSRAGRAWAALAVRLRGGSR